MPGLGLGNGLGLSKRRASSAPDGTPALSSPTAAADGQNGVKTLSIITTVGDGTVVASTYPAADTPTAAAVELGTGATITDSKTVTATGLQTFPNGTGLDAITEYKTWYVHRSAAGLLSSAVASATFITNPGVYATGGVIETQVTDGLPDPTIVITVGGVEVFNGPVSLANLQADAYALVDPAIGVVGGGAPATDSTLEDLDADVWTFDPAINPAPTPTRQWDSDGAPVSGATASTYAITASEIDTDMTLDKTLLTVPATSNTIIIPPASFAITDLFVSDTSGAAFRYDLGAYSDVGMTTPAGDTDNVLALADQSGNGKHLTVTSTVKPTLVAGSYIHFADDVWLGRATMDDYNDVALTVMLAWEVPTGAIFDPEYRYTTMMGLAGYQNSFGAFGSADTTISTQGAAGYGTSAPITFATATPFTLVGVWQGVDGAATADAVVYTNHVAGTPGTQATNVIKAISGLAINSDVAWGSNSGTQNLGFKGALIVYGTLTAQETIDAEAWLHGA